MVAAFRARKIDLGSESSRRSRQQESVANSGAERWSEGAKIAIH